MSATSTSTSTSTSTVKRLIAVTLLVSCLSTSPFFVNASSSNGKGPGWFGKVLGANIPDDRENDDYITNKGRKGSGSGSGSGGNNNAAPPPPPFMPPPPKASGDEVEGKQKKKDGTGTALQHTPPPPPPSAASKNEQPPQLNDPGQQWLQSWDMNLPQQQQQQQQQQDQYNGWQPHMQYENQQPPQWMDDHNRQNQNQNDHNNQGQSHSETLYHLQSEIDHLLHNQQDLHGQIQNLTGTLISTEQSNEMHTSQIDLLMEQVADAEAYACAESNAALEFKANCTSLGDTIVGLQSSMEELERKCKNLLDQERCDGEEIGELKGKLKKKERELENMACGIEMARLERQKGVCQLEIERKKGLQLQGGGIFSWLFGWGGGYGGYGGGEDSDDELEKLQEQARSTLLNALQVERNNVDELENSLAMVQQNNSAIGEMVASRDSLIDELNDRVAVFEEDKVVLKAALRQLQKEMKDEAPKTKKLMKELKAANSAIKKLESSIESLNENHAADVDSLNEELKLKDSQINETDSRMAMISVYVDQLEERLASFAMARRDITLREEKCDVLVNTTIAVEAELADLMSENEVIKAVRDSLQSEKGALLNEKEKLVFGGKTLRGELDRLNEDFLRLESEAAATKQQLEEAHESFAAQEKLLDEVKAHDEEATVKLAEQENMIQKSVDVTMALQKELQNLYREKQNAEETIATLELKVEEAREEKDNSEETMVWLEQQVEIAKVEVEASEEQSHFDCNNEESHRADDIDQNGSDQPILGEYADVNDFDYQNDVEDSLQADADVEDVLAPNEISPPPPPPPEESIREDHADVNNFDHQNDGEDLVQADADVEDVLAPNDMNSPPENLDELASIDGFYEQDANSFNPGDADEDNHQNLDHRELDSEDDIASEDSCSDLDIPTFEDEGLDGDNDTQSTFSIKDGELDYGFDDEEVPLGENKETKVADLESEEAPSFPYQETNEEEAEPSFPIADNAKDNEEKRERVQFRGFRKQVSKLTGVHGFFTDSSNQNRQKR